MKKIIRLTESDLHRIIENSVKKIDNKNIAEKFKEYLLNYFKHNSFESWIIK